MARRPKSDLGSPAQTRFWETKALADMSRDEWESLCDGCGKCCLLKLEDADSGETYFTDVACKLLDPETCRCSDYARRKMFVPDCIQLSADSLDQIAHWLPPTCAYRLLSEGRPLYDWHPLISGDPQSVHWAGASCSHRVISEEEIDDEDQPERIVDWANADPAAD